MRDTVKLLSLHWVFMPLVGNGLTKAIHIYPSLLMYVLLLSLVSWIMQSIPHTLTTVYHIPLPIPPYIKPLGYTMDTIMPGLYTDVIVSNGRIPSTITICNKAG